ncbi:AraC family transcriptional regulator [Rhodopseudomonas sp. HC1]|uniref:helix-turn-helix domain-containing protein n=1 Tax=Rhodopseudomonas infernalis TaxID=2897386 RepID=UPI001EE8DA10|nr:AraC family transcriptional regulator [Rhodopseudomonas infernalis]MCG6205601.1 AraC family transcriptional regulator [Rhodopseudomonas infernalis]
MRMHDIGSWPRNATLASSSGRGWSNIQAALIAVDTWCGELAPIGNPCLGYCVSQPARIRKRVGGGGAVETTTLRPRQFHLIPALEASEWHRHGRSEMLTLYLRQDLLDEAAARLCSEHVGRVELDVPLGVHDPLLEQLALAVLKMLRLPEDAGARYYADELAHAAYAHVVRNYTAAGRSSAFEGDAPAAPEHALRRVCQLIAERIADDLPLEALAREAGLSPRSLSRAFNQRLGMSVHQYVVSRRILKAKDLLASTDLPIVEVALESGFSSQSHLSEVFRKQLGVTPGLFRSARE